MEKIFWMTFSALLSIGLLVIILIYGGEINRNVMAFADKHLTKSEEEVAREDYNENINQDRTWIGVKSSVSNKCYEILIFDYDASYSNKSRLGFEIDCELLK